MTDERVDLTRHSLRPLSNHVRLTSSQYRVADPEPTAGRDPVRAVCADRKSSYAVYLSRTLLNSTTSPLPASLSASHVLLVTTPTVSCLYAPSVARVLDKAGIRASTITLPCTDASKTLELVDQVCGAALERGLGRHDCLVALGGGVCSDIVTVAASLLRRGIDHVRIPTTLIGQVDAGIGVKGAVNFGDRKNSLGTYHPPACVFVNPELLSSLDESHIRYGLAEIIKIAIVRDRTLFELVEEHYRELIASRFQSGPSASRILWLSIVGMLDELEPNLFEDRTHQRLVDFGHSFSPTLEAASGFTIQHGAAVAIDVALTTTISWMLGLLTREDRNRIVALVDRILPVTSRLLTPDLCHLAMQECELRRAGALNLVVPEALGRARFINRTEDVPMRLVRSALAMLWDETERTAGGPR